MSRHCQDVAGLLGCCHVEAVGATLALQGHRFPAEIISHGVWLYYRFGVSLRDASELMLARGIEVSYQAIRLWTLRFGLEYARGLKHRRSATSNVWHLLNSVS